MLCFPVRGLGAGEPSNHLGCISAVNGFKAGQAALGGKELSEYFLDFLSVLKAEFWALTDTFFFWCYICLSTEGRPWRIII